MKSAITTGTAVICGTAITSAGFTVTAGTTWPRIIEPEYELSIADALELAQVHSPAVRRVVNDRVAVEFDGPFDGEIAMYHGDLPLFGLKITIDPACRAESPEALATLLIHEATHHVQNERSDADDITLEVEAIEAQNKFWMWQRKNPPRTDLERQLDRYLYSDVKKSAAACADFQKPKRRIYESYTKD